MSEESKTDSYQKTFNWAMVVAVFGGLAAFYPIIDSVAERITKGGAAVGEAVTMEIKGQTLELKEYNEELKKLRKQVKKLNKTCKAVTSEPSENPN